MVGVDVDGRRSPGHEVDPDVAHARDRRNQREATARPDGDGIPVDDSRANGNGIQGDGIRTDGIQGDGIRTDATTPTSATA